jgi:hypothetical protein
MRTIAALRFVADHLGRHAAEVRERERVPFEERLLRLMGERMCEPLT